MSSAAYTPGDACSPSVSTTPGNDVASGHRGAAAAAVHPVSVKQFQQVEFDAKRQRDMLESMETKARQLCDDTRCHYDLLLQRQRSQHERQLLALQNKLKEVIGSSVSLSEHRQALGELAKAHERDMRAITKVHEDEVATLRLRWKQLTNEQQLQRSRAFQTEKDMLLDKMTQLEAERNDAMKLWHEQELATLAAQKEMHSALEAAQGSEGKLEEACRHIKSLKAQLQKVDRITAKLKAERRAHAAERTEWQREMKETTTANAELSKRVCVLEVECRHAQEDHTRTAGDVVELRLVVGRSRSWNKRLRAQTRRSEPPQSSTSNSGRSSMKSEANGAHWSCSCAAQWHRRRSKSSS